MENPWRSIKKTDTEYIAPCDRACIQCYQGKVKNTYQLHLALVPGPYSGDPEQAVVYLLGLNPGYGEGEEAILAKKKKLKTSLIKTLKHQKSDSTFGILNAEWEDTNGNSWWHEKLKEVINNTSARTVSRFVFSAEYFPYHSTSYPGIKNLPILPSQHYTFDLVRKAIKDNKLIVIMRSEKRWNEAIAELKNYTNKIILKNKRNPTVSSRNMTTKEFNTIIAVLKNAENTIP